MFNSKNDLKEAKFLYKNVVIFIFSIGIIFLTIIFTLESENIRFIQISDAETK